MKVLFIIFIILFFSSGFFYYKIIEKTIQQEFYVVRVIDGDTLELENQVKVRLLGINTPEKNQPYYEQAKQLLQNLIENKTITLEWKSSDKYGRILAYVFSGKKLINKELLFYGFANLYYYEKDRYFAQMQKSEEIAKEKEKGIWERSSNYNCLELIELKFREPEQIILNNSCSPLNIILKDDATHIYQEIVPIGIWQKNFSKIWNNEGDSLFIWDDSGLLVFYRYGSI